jgi:hypothetical protein
MFAQIMAGAALLCSIANASGLTEGNAASQQTAWTESQMAAQVMVAGIKAARSKELVDSILKVSRRFPDQKSPEIAQFLITQLAMWLTSYDIEAILQDTQRDPLPLEKDWRTVMHLLSNPDRLTLFSKFCEANCSEASIAEIEIPLSMVTQDCTSFDSSAGNINDRGSGYCNTMHSYQADAIKNPSFPWKKISGSDMETIILPGLWEFETKTAAKKLWIKSKLP